MSKSKSRHTSRQLAAASRSGSNGAARTATTASKTTVKVAVEDAPESTEQDESTATLLADDAAESAEQETSVAAEDVSESTEKETSPARSAKSVTGKAAAKSAGDEASASTEQEISAAKTAKAASGKAVPAKGASKAVPNTPVGAGGKMQSRDAAKYERRQAERQMRYLAERRRRRNRIIIALSVILALAVIGAGTFYIVHQFTSGAAQAKASQGSYQEPIYNSNYPPVDSVYCDSGEQGIEHIHAYVAIYINGQASTLPANVGIPQDSSGNATCFYWLHTHDASGVVHIESPSKEVFTFGQFRDEWDQQFVNLGFPPELLLTTGWKIWINGKVYNGSLSSIPLDAHNIITIAYNSPKVKPVTTYAWNGL